MVWERRSGWWDFARIAVIIARVKGGRLSAAFKHAWGRFCEKAHWFYILCREVTLRYEGATMKQSLTNLRQKVMEASMNLIRAQRAYLDAAGKSESELKEAAEDYLKATGPYDAALQELRQFLLAAEPSELIAVELEHTERLIEALNKEKQVGSK